MMSRAIFDKMPCSAAAAVRVGLAMVIAFNATGCLDEFMTEAQVRARIEAFQLSFDVAQSQTDTPATDVADQSSAVDSEVVSAAEVETALDSDGNGNGSGDGGADVDGSDQSTLDSDASIDAVVDGACLPTSATADSCNGLDDDCDGQTDEDTCDDGNACTKEDSCSGGKCAGKSTNCDDKDPCTLDGCATSGPSAGICTHNPADGSPCDDEDLCSFGDICKGGNCAGVAKTCFNSNFCYKAYCAPTGGKCVSAKKNAGTGCDDGNACTNEDVCDGDSVCNGKVVNCDDANPCTLNACNLANGCTATDASAPCDDGNLCTQGDLCKAGKCQSGQVVVCNDSNSCTTESCDGGKCKITKNSQPCDDGTACTSGDACADGQCTGAAVDCDDKKPCTNDACNSQTGCLHNPATILCDDSNACTTLDQCKDSNCTGVDQSASLCDDGLPCTKDTCDAKAGCGHSDSVGDCDDGNPCTTGDSCANGKCTTGDPLASCKCTTNADCAAKEDGSLCNGTLFCDKSNASPTCKVNPTTVVVCDDSADSGCAKNTCADKLGSCSMVAVADGKACNADNNACTSGDQCKVGSCAAGTVQVCDDKNPCTDDSCDPATGCVGLANQATCDADTNPCTPIDLCASKGCTPGQAKACDDGNPCTADACDPQSGQCTTTAQSGSCSDGNPCTLNDVCAAAACKAGAAQVCDDGNICTTDSCDTTGGTCTAAAKTGPCSDGNACTSSDSCANGSCQPGKATLCDDASVCTNDSCNPTTGTCSFAAISGACSDNNACTVGDSCVAGGCQPGANSVCSDNNGCTSDSCNPADGLCVYAPTKAQCDDKNECTAGEACNGGVCKNGQWTCACTAATEAKTCNDNNVCTADKCLASGGKLECKNVPKSNGACSDNNPCTINDSCSSDACQGNGSLNCDDKLPCTIDACNPANGSCSHTPGGDMCNDGNPCTTVDKCVDGTCAGSAPKVCDDGKQCTTDTCDSDDGLCYFKNNSFPCDDGNLCTSGDTCKDSTCKPGAPKACTDANPCTDDKCAATTGQCAFAANVATCDDFDSCTVGDACANTTCKGTPVVCNDNNPCTNEACDPANGSGACKTLANTVNCDDYNKCTVGDVCSAGACKPGTLKSCADNTVCTDDSCQASSGICINTQNTKPCDDGTKCTNNDVCASGLCKSGAVVVCNDSKVCTDDLCDPATGACGYTPNAKICDDGNACTEVDACQGGNCVGGKFTCVCQVASEKADCDDKQACTNDTCTTVNGTLVCSNSPLTGSQCDDGNVCTLGDSCASGLCKSTSSKACDDANTCTADSCNPTSACGNSPVSGNCSDGNPCTLNDLCSAGTCQAGAQRDCNDANPCTNDACTTNNGLCTNLSNFATCTDGNSCTLSDFCTAGACNAGTAKVCNDNKACTDDACDKLSGACSAKSDDTNTCNDHNQCTLTDVCDAGTCVGKSAKSCEDGNLCTTDGPCNPTSGQCAYANNSVTCDDLNKCTENDKCTGGGCSGSSVSCNDNEVCTIDSCNKTVGCGYVNNTISCNDNSKCTSNDQCKGGKCSGTTVVCNDSNTCTSETCVQALGCLFTGDTNEECKLTNPCLIKSTCTEFGACVGVPACGYFNESVCKINSCTYASPMGMLICGADKTGVPRDCNDHNSCTLDACGKDGCQWSATNEGFTCSSNGHVCKSGLCVPKS
ncbi:MAG: hypothetical protein EXR77_10840 [Myxococcales bacterium]|nr:hypothetical protein [Myxococcales bacterium]